MLHNKLSIIFAINTLTNKHKHLIRFSISFAKHIEIFSWNIQTRNWFSKLFVEFSDLCRVLESVLNAISNKLGEYTSNRKHQYWNQNVVKELRFILRTEIQYHNFYLQYILEWTSGPWSHESIFGDDNLNFVQFFRIRNNAKISKTSSSQLRWTLLISPSMIWPLIHWRLEFFFSMKEIFGFWYSSSESQSTQKFKFGLL